MKKSILTAFSILAITGYAIAQQFQTESQERPNATFETFFYDFGAIKEGDMATYDFKFTNTGNAPLIIQSVVAQCGCTTPEWSRDTITPGGTGRVRAVYNSNQRPGIFEKSVTVKTNAPGNDIVLRIKGDVIPKPIEPLSPVRNQGVE
jgi:hypothetical protein